MEGRLQTPGPPRSTWPSGRRVTGSAAKSVWPIAGRRAAHNIVHKPAAGTGQWLNRLLSEPLLLAALRSEVGQVAIVFLADVLQDFAAAHRERAGSVRRPGDAGDHGPRLGVILRIVNRRFHLDVVEVGAREPLGDLQLFAVRMAGSVEPGPIVIAERFDHQRIAVPVCDGVTQISWIYIVGVRKLPSIHIDHAPDVRTPFINEQDAIRQLVDLRGIRSVEHARIAGRQTEAFRIVLHVVLEEPLFPQRLGRRLERRIDVLAALFVVPVDLQIDDVGDAPHALGQPAEIRLAGLYAILRFVREAWDRRQLSLSSAPTASDSAGSPSWSLSASARGSRGSLLRDLFRPPLRRSGATGRVGRSETALGGSRHREQR